MNRKLLAVGAMMCFLLGFGKADAGFLVHENAQPHRGQPHKEITGVGFFNSDEGDTPVATAAPVQARRMATRMPIGYVAGSSITLPGLQPSAMGILAILRGSSATGVAPSGARRPDLVHSVSSCVFSELLFEPKPCNSSGLFLIDLSFKVDNPSSGQYLILAGGETYGPFLYMPAPSHVIGPFSVNDAPIPIKIVDQNDANCYIEAVVPPPNCNALDECELSDLEIEEGACTSDSTYLITIDFQADDAPNDFFDLSVNGAYTGTYALTALPLTIEIAASDNGEDHIEVCINDTPDCCEDEWIDAPSCPAAECHIDNLVVEPWPCNNDSFFVDLSFEVSQPASDSFEVYGNGHHYGTFSYDHEWITLGPFPADGTTYYEFAVQDAFDEDCREDVELGPVSCTDTLPCNLDNVEVEIVACPSDSGMALSIHFDIDSLDDQDFELFLDSTFVGSFPIDSLPIAVPAISWPVNDTTIHFELCIDSLNACCVAGIIDFEWCDDPVWPGDANANNASDVYDLLHLGLGWGASGQPRPVSATAWQPWAGPDWPLAFADGTNYKHADCNGDGIIDAADTSAIAQNYGLTHDMVLPLPGVEATLDDPSIWVELPPELANGEPFTAPIMVGDATHPIDSIYGLAFMLFFDPEVVDPNSVDVVVDNTSWLGTPGADLVSINRTFAQNGLLHVAITRTDQQNVSGFGQAANFIGFIDDIWSKQQTSVSIGGVRALTASETLIPLQAPLQTRPVKSTTTATRTSSSELSVAIWPNPARGWLYINLDQGRIIPKTIELWSVRGRRVATVPAHSHVIDVRHLPKGIYLLRIITETGTITRRIAIE